MGGMARCVLDPRTNQWVAWWDLVTTLALLFTALVTPVEVAFLQAPNNWAERLASPLFWTNRCIDVIFIADMILQFFLAYKTEDVREGTRWIVEPKKIAWHYLCSFWFPLDLFCVLTLLFDVLGDEGTKDLQGLRAVRTLRLAKLVKLARGSRILKRWEMHFSINYSMLGLTNVTITILVGCHWTACIWGLQAMFQPLATWAGEKEYCVPFPDLAHRYNFTNATRVLEEDCPPGNYCTIGTCDEVEDTCVGNGYSCVDPWQSTRQPSCPFPRLASPSLSPTLLTFLLFHPRLLHSPSVCVLPLLCDHDDHLCWIRRCLRDGFQRL